MPYLRLLLLILNVVCGCLLLYLLFTDPPYEVYFFLIAVGFDVTLFLNVLYLLVSHSRRKEWRVMRLIRLWMDAKEAELNKRAERDGQS